MKNFLMLVFTAVYFVIFFFVVDRLFTLLPLNCRFARPQMFHVEHFAAFHRKMPVPACPFPAFAAGGFCFLARKAA